MRDAVRVQEPAPIGRRPRAATGGARVADLRLLRPVPAVLADVRDGGQPPGDHDLPRLQADRAAGRPASQAGQNGGRKSGPL